MEKRIVITGGAGFIGSHLADRLLELGAEILVIDNYSTGRRDNLSVHKKLKVIEGTIADEKMVNAAFENFKPDLVVHAAASYKDPLNWTEDVMTNGIGAVNIVKASQRANVKRIVYFQTSLCYGLKPVEQPITLSHPLYSGGYAGGSSYAISKTTGEQYIELSGLDFMSFRLANAYGPRNLSGPLPTFYQRLTTGKPCFVMDTRRDFIYVDDVVDVVVKALQGTGEKGYFHISTGTDYSIKQLFDATVKALGMTPEHEVEVRARNEDDVFTILIDPSKTEKMFNWKAKTLLEAGIKNAIDWYKANGINQTFTHLKNEEKK